ITAGSCQPTIAEPSLARAAISDHWAPVLQVKSRGAGLWGASNARAPATSRPLIMNDVEIQMPASVTDRTHGAAAAEPADEQGHAPAFAPADAAAPCPALSRQRARAAHGRRGRCGDARRVLHRAFHTDPLSHPSLGAGALQPLVRAGSGAARWRPLGGAWALVVYPVVQAAALSAELRMIRRGPVSARAGDRGVILARPMGTERLFPRAFTVDPLAGLQFQSRKC
ncbi:unnamed protein product, partial [Prorocentrum cordatum]